MVQIGHSRLFVSSYTKIIGRKYIKMIYYLDSVGFYGPLILAFINIAYLWGRERYQIAYLLFFLLNTFLNGILKNIIQEPRPTGQIYFNEHDIKPDDKIKTYGMPSGHAQSTGYSIAFLYLVTQSPALLICSVFIGSLTLYQRFKYRRHSISQLFVGLFIGSAFAKVTYTYLVKPE
jgi:membrane-associated phospholipid phosphatase